MTADHVAAFSSLLPPGQVTELRIVKPFRASGYFDDAAKLMTAAKNASARAEGVYWVPNPINPELLARAVNRVRDRPDATTSDRDILRRLWMLIDVDPERPAGISSSDAEHDAAIALCREICAELHANGWPLPLIGDSGNGGHLMYRIDLPTDDGGLIQRCLAALAKRFNRPGCRVDLTTFNPARIWKLYGTPTRKGDATRERPHRHSKILELPEELVTVPDDLLIALGGVAPVKPFRRPRGGEFDVDSWIRANVPEASDSKPWPGHPGGRKWILSPCPWNRDHDRGEAFVAVQADGTISAGCKHDSCASYRWSDLRELREPGYDRKRRARDEPPPHNDADAPDAPPRPPPPERPKVSTPPDWRDQLVYTPTTNGGQILDKIPGNLGVLIQNLEGWAGCLAFDALLQRPVWIRAPADTEISLGPVRDEHAVVVQHWFRANRWPTWSIANVELAISWAASLNPFHPVRDYLSTLRWDGTARVGGWLSRYFADTPAPTVPVGGWWLISAIARVMKPGCQVDHMLVLEGAQGVGKSTAASILGGQWFSCELGDLRDKDAAQTLAGVWIVEMAELDALRKADATRVKTFLSTRCDHFRPSYGHHVVDRPRQCVFMGTTNESKYLHDPSGGRRFWPHRVGVLDAPALMRDRDQIWAEAVELYQSGERWWPRGVEESRLLSESVEERYASDPWEGRIGEHMASCAGVWTIASLLTSVLHVDVEHQDRAAATRVGVILARLGYQPTRRMVGGTRERYYSGKTDLLANAPTLDN